MINDIIVMLLAYLIGAIPSGFVVTKLLYKKDIRREGSGNVGAMNTYDVTGSKLSGMLVFFIDFLKGLFAIFLVSTFFDSDFYLIRLAAVFVVIGHNYNAFLGLKGGRGLSPAAGAYSLINPLPILFWVIMYFTTKKVLNDNVHVSILGGCVGSVVLLVGFPEVGFEALSVAENFEILPFKILHAAICIVVISKLVKPLRELYSSND